MDEIRAFFASKWFLHAWTVALAGFLGIFSAWFALERGYAAHSFRQGPWLGWPSAGFDSGNPYARAAVARSNGALVGGSEGFALFSNQDNDGLPLHGQCTYRIDGQFLGARWWTLTIYDQSRNAPPKKEWERRSLTESEIVRRPNGSFSLTISPHPSDGNWLPVDTHSNLVLVLRLYDADVIEFEKRTNPTLPTIQRIRCPA